MFRVYSLYYWYDSCSEYSLFIAGMIHVHSILSLLLVWFMFRVQSHYCWYDSCSEYTLFIAGMIHIQNIVSLLLLWFMFRVQSLYCWYDSCSEYSLFIADMIHVQQIMFILKTEKSANHNPGVFIINIWGIVTTCFSPKGLSVGNTYIQIYYEKTLGYGWFICKWDCICTIHWFLLKGNMGVYRCHFHF